MNAGVDVLPHLVANRGRLVERDELLRVVRTRRVVEDNNAVQAIFELRKVLKSVAARIGAASRE